MEAEEEILCQISLESIHPGPSTSNESSENPAKRAKVTKRGRCKYCKSTLNSSKYSTPNVCVECVKKST